MKKTGLTLLLVAIVCALLFWIWSMLSTPIKFQSHFAERSKAVIEKEEYIIKLVQGYRDSNKDKKFTTNWDELIDFALNGTMEYRSQIYDENNLKNAEILAELRKDKNWKNERILRVPARDTLFDDDLGVCRLTEQDIRELRYIPFTHNAEEFELDTATYEVGSYRTHLIRCHAPYVHFINTEEYNQQFWNMLETKFDLYIANAEASDQMKKMKADGLKQAIQKIADKEDPSKMVSKYYIGSNVPVAMDIEFFGVTFGSLEENSDKGSWEDGRLE